MKKNAIKRIDAYGLLIVIMLLISGCGRFLEIEPPKSDVNSETVFKNPGTATAALLGLYQSMFSGFAGGGTGSVTVLAGLSADELVFHPLLPAQLDREEINQNNISPNNGAILSLWTNLYSVIYGANMLLERVGDGQQLPVAVTNQLIGEARFIRAFSYFYLVNLFGEVPLVIGTSYAENAQLLRHRVDGVYAQVISDLEIAFERLDTMYTGEDRLRANRWTAAALLARVHLYRGDLEQAERWSGRVLEQTDVYWIEPDISDVFLVGSAEAIWQRASPGLNQNTSEANVFITNNEHFLTESLRTAFRPIDRRGREWIAEKETVAQAYIPFKYQSTSQAVTTEHSFIFRLAEQYLIRAEARLMLGNRVGAMADVDRIRERAGLKPVQQVTPDIGDEALLDTIHSERQRELFAEWGHRWFDLKRTGNAVAALAELKPGFIPADEWYPIPESELLKNPNLAILTIDK